MEGALLLGLCSIKESSRGDSSMPACHHTGGVCKHLAHGRPSRTQGGLGSSLHGSGRSHGSRQTQAVGGAPQGGGGGGCHTTTHHRCFPATCSGTSMAQTSPADIIEEAGRFAVGHFWSVLDDFVDPPPHWSSVEPNHPLMSFQSSKLVLKLPPHGALPPHLD